ncbi:hypothetical protein IMZ48_05055 [Candidatus Bathyarchaeota archaeon]|nr:hypothetical protein [Candidatus Bathyarchaeota archaeon]
MTDRNSSSDQVALVGYVSDPDGRGTPSLVISCLVTLILCVWSAVHLNVPRRDETKLQSFLVAFRWIVAGIYAPELVVFVAWRQWSSARLLQRIVDDSLQKRGGDAPASGRRFQWTMEHSFFACAGGFAFELQSLADSIHDQPKGESQHAQRLTITARGISLLARCGCLPDIEAEQIKDKSKANDLAKAAVLAQATWMLFQAVGRLAYRLPVTLLEVNTVAHV